MIFGNMELSEKYFPKISLKVHFFLKTTVNKMHTFFYIFLILMTERRLYLSMLVCVTVDFVVIKKILKDYKES